MERVLFNPDWFFGEKSEEKVSLRMPFLIVLINGIFAAASSILVMNKVMASLPPDIAPFMAAGAAIGAIGGLIGVFLYWLILAGVFYLISCLFDSDGSFKRTFEFVGYGFLPMIFSSFVALLVWYSILPSIEFSLQDPQLMQQSMMQMMVNNPFLLMSQIIGILCTLWSGYIWIFAVKNARKMATKNASIVVGVPVGLYVLYTIYNFVSMAL